MASTSTHLSSISRLFSSSVFREMARNGRSPLFARLYAQTGLSHSSELDTNVGAAFESAFAVLRRSGARNEYVYRAALVHNLLLGRHSLRTAGILTEFRVGSCKADVAILNGTSTVYEIKSDRDSLSRLANQLANYRKVFAKIYVIAGDAHVQDIIDAAPHDVGVMSLVRWNRIRTIREAVARPDAVCPVTIFESLRSSEARSVLRHLGVPIPDVPNTLLHGAMRECFARLAPEDVHQRMVNILKQTRGLSSLRSFIDELPAALRPAALTLQLPLADRERLVNAIRTPLVDALTWE